ncbi:MAG: hypothetical protein A4E57_00332 [Syntrophorhabdaceae bacterium PtaU1.Bin034]|nr:MAG: hypothetical protein A4E57_00332 [Syntrophorhabdaceae bacterium PtaU1.Bin034]
MGQFGTVSISLVTAVLCFRGFVILKQTRTRRGARDYVCTDQVTKETGSKTAKEVKGCEIKEER